MNHRVTSTRAAVHWRRGLFLAISFIILPLLAGCGGGSDQPAPSVDESQQTTPVEDKQVPPADTPGQSEPEPEPVLGFRMVPQKTTVGFSDPDFPTEVPIDLFSQKGFDLNKLSFEVEGLPEYVTGEFSDITTSGEEGSVVLSLRITTLTAPRGNHEIKITGSGEGITQTETITLQVTRLGC